MITKLLKITRSAWIAFFIAFIAAFIMAGAAGAQNEDGDPEIRAKNYGVTFPIAELGGCKNYYECRSFCEDPVNAPACLDYGKKKGFYKDGQENIDKEKIEKAKKELGCDSKESCNTFCQIPTNFEKCDSFAKKEGLSGGHVEDPKKEAVMKKAKDVLGCDSYTTCASFCSDEANRTKCTQFAKETGLKGGEQRVGPGGCTSEATCRTFCSDPNNFQVCRGFAQSVKQEFTGPGGCNSEESCQSYCERNPRECGPPPGGNGGPVVVPLRYDPQEMCNRTPACSWKDNTCVCGDYNSSENKQKRDESAKVCRENPARCTPGGIGGPESREDMVAFEKYCRENPEKCRPAYYDMMGGRTYDPAQECTKYAGCAWTGGTCQCGSRYETYSSPPGMGPSASGAPGGVTGSSGGTTSGGGYGSREDQERGCKSGGGSCDWSSGVCNCRGYRSSGTSTSTSTGTSTTTNTTQSSGTTATNTTSTTTSGMSRESQEAGCRSCGGSCSWNGDMCNCQCAGSSGGSTSTSTTTTTQSQPAPATVQENQPAPAPPATEPAPAPAVQGITAVRNLVERILDLFR